MKSLIVYFYSVNCITSWSGSCRNAPIIPDFELAKYAGTWYEQLRYPNAFQSTKNGGKCTTATYERIDDVTVSVNNSRIERVARGFPVSAIGQWTLGWGLGKAVQPMPNEAPNRLRVELDSMSAFSKWLIGSSPNYNVVATDYENYALIFSCQKILFWKVEYAWILSRARDFRDTPQFSQVRQMAVDDFGLQTENNIFEKQTDCTFSLYGEEYG